MRLLVCGSRDWINAVRVDLEMESLLGGVSGVVIHGAAQGADDLARAVALGRWDLAAFPADWRTHGKAAGPIRNAKMLREGEPDRGLAFGALWRRDERSKLGWRHTGTGDMVHRMLLAGLPVRWVAGPSVPSVDLVAMPRPWEVRA